jgi:hypothetical protein
MLNVIARRVIVGKETIGRTSTSDSPNVVNAHPHETHSVLSEYKNDYQTRSAGGFFQNI